MYGPGREDPRDFLNACVVTESRKPNGFPGDCFMEINGLESVIASGAPALDDKEIVISPPPPSPFLSSPFK